MFVPTIHWENDLHPSPRVHQSALARRTLTARASYPKPGADLEAEPNAFARTARLSSSSRAPATRNDATKRVRLRRDTVQLWLRLLDIADHRDRWDRTPFRANLDDLIQAVLPDFAWVPTPSHQ